jgi:CheY-like chemotaxis protein
MVQEKVTELIKRNRTDEQIYHDLMKFKVREILLVATVYDAFILEEEDILTEKIFGEYHQLNLSSAPRITNVSFGPEALEMLASHAFDMVILTMRIDEITPFELSRRIREINPGIPILLLLNDNTEIGLIRDMDSRLAHIDRVFVWNGDSKIFLAMIKYIEDKLNVDTDTLVGHVRVILLVEDSIRYYSRYLPILYTEIMKQTQRIIADEHLYGIKKLLRMRARPKVLMAASYEEAVAVIEEYRDYLLCVMSDVIFPKAGGRDEEAGLRLIAYLQSQIKDLPILLQSSDPGIERRAHEVHAGFLNKNSHNLSGDLKEYISHYLGFGDFVFRDPAGVPIARASSMEELRQLLATVPLESLVYHANRNHFSSWLMARGEIQIAKNVQPVKVSDFEDPGELRGYLIGVCRKVREAKTRGKMIGFSPTALDEKSQLIRFGDGSLGGKGRGMAFLHMLIQNCEFDRIVPGVNIRIPQTSVIGTGEYDQFITANGVDRFFGGKESFPRIKQKLSNAELTAGLREKLRMYVAQVRCPISVRSSGQFEDSLSQPFAGIYDTYLLPNNHPDDKMRLAYLEQAVKLVYASVFSPSARSYFDAIDYKIDEEKMSVLLQRVVGNRFGDYFYPHFSGVAQSYNYYPISYLKPEDGIAVAGFGLGKHVIDGEKAHRFCPKYPEIDFVGPAAQLKESQQTFYAINMKDSVLHLLEGEAATLKVRPIEAAEGDGTLAPCVSVWDYQNDRLQVGPGLAGPRVLNFAPILKYGTFPLARILEAVLAIIKSAMGTPVEIEFAVDLNPAENGLPSFYILQIKPLLGNLEDFTLDLSRVNRKELLLYTERAMGNGRLDDICDLIYVDPEKFDKAKTLDMTVELEKLNHILKQEKRRYILVGPGRWGSSDRWLGIPVTWSHISNAKVIVEVEREDLRVDPSLGSHFFHNVTSMNIGYFDLPYNSATDFIDWDWLTRQPVTRKTKHFVHIRFARPLVVKMDGRKRISVIYK